jgi:hypothetical protein
MSTTFKQAATTTARNFAQVFKIADKQPSMPHVKVARQLSKGNPNFRPFIPVVAPLSGGTALGVHAFDPHHQPHPPRRAMSTSARAPAAAASSTSSSSSSSKQGVKSWDPSLRAQLQKRAAAQRHGSSRTVFPPTKFQQLVDKSKTGESDFDLKLHSFVARVQSERASADSPAATRPSQ